MQRYTEYPSVRQGTGQRVRQSVKQSAYQPCEKANQKCREDGSLTDAFQRVKGK